MVQLDSSIRKKYNEIYGSKLVTPEDKKTDSLNMKSLKTPLRYPGGKSRACNKLDVYIPDLRDYKEYREPFLGGGSVALHVTKKYPHLKIWVNDLYTPLVNFWKTLQDDGYKLYKRLQELKSRYPDPASAKGLFLEAKEIINDNAQPNLYRATAFLRLSTSALFLVSLNPHPSQSRLSISNFSMRGIEKLQGYTQLIKDWKITNGRYQELLTDDKECFTYLDPPTIYGITFMDGKEICTTDLTTTVLLPFL